MPKVIDAKELAVLGQIHRAITFCHHHNCFDTLALGGSENVMKVAVNSVPVRTGEIGSQEVRS